MPGRLVMREISGPLRRHAVALQGSAASCWTNYVEACAITGLACPVVWRSLLLQSIGQFTHHMVFSLMLIKAQSWELGGCSCSYIEVLARRCTSSCHNCHWPLLAAVHIVLAKPLLSSTADK